MISVLTLCIPNPLNFLQTRPDLVKWKRVGQTIHILLNVFIISILIIKIYWCSGEKWTQNKTFKLLVVFIYHGIIILMSKNLWHREFQCTENYRMTTCLFGYIPAKYSFLYVCIRAGALPWICHLQGTNLYSQVYHYWYKACYETTTHTTYIYIFTRSG